MRIFQIKGRQFFSFFFLKGRIGEIRKEEEEEVHYLNLMFCYFKAAVIITSFFGRTRHALYFLLKELKKGEIIDEYIFFPPFFFLLHPTIIACRLLKKLK